MKVRIRLFRARPKFYMITDNPNVTHGFVDCSLYTRCIGLKVDYHKKRMDMLAYMLRWNTTIWKLWQRHLSFHPVKINSPRKLFQQCSHSSSRNSHEYKLCFHWFFHFKPFWYQYFDLRHIRILRGEQPVVDYDTSDNCRLYVTTMKAMNFQDDIPAIPIDNFQDQYVLVFDLTSMQDATEPCHYPEFVGELLRLEPKFDTALEHVTEVIVLGERMSSVAVDNFGVVGKNIQ